MGKQYKADAPLTCTLPPVVVYELIGPVLTRIALQKAGEISTRPVSAREQASTTTKNRPYPEALCLFLSRCGTEEAFLMRAAR